MKQTVVFIVLAIIALAGCAPAPAPTPSVPSPSVPSAPVATPIIPEPEPVVQEVEDYAMSEATLAKLKKSLTSTTKWTLSETFTQIPLGGHHTFGIGFTNRLREKDNFLVSVEFKRAYDKSGNSIEAATAAQVAPWLAENDFSVAPLDADEQSIQPIVIETASFADGSTPPRGTYEFNVNVLHQGSFFEVNQEYSGDLLVSVQVT